MQALSGNFPVLGIYKNPKCRSTMSTLRREGEGRNMNTGIDKTHIIMGTLTKYWGYLQRHESKQVPEHSHGNLLQRVVAQIAKGI